MFVLTRKIGEAIALGDDIRIVVVGIGHKKVRLGVAAPAQVVVDRQEIHEQRKTLLNGLVGTNGTAAVLSRIPCDTPLPCGNKDD